LIEYVGVELDEKHYLKSVGQRLLDHIWVYSLGNHF